MIWKRKAFAADLKATLATITGELAPADPFAAVDQILRFTATAERVFDRVDDSSGQVQAIYQEAAEALPAIAATGPITIVRDWRSASSMRLVITQRRKRCDGTPCSVPG